MPWNNQGGGGNGPWGQGPRRGQGGGGGGQQTPDLEDLLRRGSDRFKNAFPGRAKGGGMGPTLPLIILLLVVLGYFASGIYRVGVDQQGVVTRFGEFDRLTQPGLHYHLPWPVEAVQTPQVTRQRSVDVGFRQLTASQRRDIPTESLILTGDENIVDVDFTVLWVIQNAADYLFNVQNQESTIKAVAESAMREVVGRNNLQDILTQDRSRVQAEVLELMQATLDEYGMGVAVRQVQLQTVDPPSAVIEAFRDVQAANQDKERLSNEAQAYANRIIPEARGESERVKQQAEAYREQVVADADGSAERFLAIYEQYRQAPDVTRQRIFLETMEGILKGTDKVLIDGDGSSQGVLPYLPLPEVQRKRGTSGNSTQGDQ